LPKRGPQATRLRQRKNACGSIGFRKVEKWLSGETPQDILEVIHGLVSHKDDIKNALSPVVNKFGNAQYLYIDPAIHDTIQTGQIPYRSSAKNPGNDFKQIYRKKDGTYTDTLPWDQKN